MARVITKQQAAGPTAVTYLRVSTTEQARRGGQAEGFSLPIQREKVRGRAQEVVAPVVEEFIDAGKSATNMNRAGLQALLDYVKREHPTYVIVYKLDRLARNLLDQLIILRTMEAAGTQLLSCSETVESTTAGKLSFAVMGAVNEYHSNNLTDELKNKLIGKIRSGGTIGKAPIGYLNTVERVEGLGEVRSVKVDEERGPLMEWAFEVYATGEWSLSSLTEVLQEKGLTAVPGPTVTAKPIPRSVLARLLRNPYYTGVLRWKGAIYPGNHEPLVTQQIFEAVQNVLDSHNVGGEKQRVHKHYLKGSVRCASCGASLCITKTVNRHGSEYLYFFCLGNYRRYTDCTARAIPVELVESHIEDKWRTVRLSHAYADTIEQMIREELTTHRARQERDKARALKRRIQLNEQRRKLLNAHYLDAIPLELLKEEQDRITKEISETERALVAAEIGIDRVESVLRRSMEFLTNCYQTYILAAPSVRRQLNQAVFEAFFVGRDGSLTAKPTEAFRTLLRTDALKPRGPVAQSPAPTGLHDSNEWKDGVPRWLAELDMNQGQNDESRSTPVFGDMGLNEDYLAEGVGFEPTGLITRRFSRPVHSSALPSLPGRFAPLDTMPLKAEGRTRAQRFESSSEVDSTSVRMSPSHSLARRRPSEIFSRSAGPCSPAAGYDPRNLHPAKAR
jgi:site-specific DNA recombinase